MGEFACAVCARPAAVTLGGFPFCGQHGRMARIERDRRRQLSITFGTLAAAHDAGPKDEDGDAFHDKDPIVSAWISDVWQHGMGRSTGG